MRSPTSSVATPRSTDVRRLLGPLTAAESTACDVGTKFGRLLVLCTLTFEEVGVLTLVVACFRAVFFSSSRAASDELLWIVITLVVELLTNVGFKGGQQRQPKQKHWQKLAKAPCILV